jgi:hypothetical protein
MVCMTAHSVVAAFDTNRVAFDNSVLTPPLVASHVQRLREEEAWPEALSDQDARIGRRGGRPKLIFAGQGVAISREGHVALVGAPHVDGGGLRATGRALLYRRSSGEGLWAKVSTLVATSQQTNSEYGKAPPSV